MNEHSAALELAWLPHFPGWAERLAKIAAAADSEAWLELVALANARIDYAATLRLDRTLRRRFSAAPATPCAAPPRAPGQVAHRSYRYMRVGTGGNSGSTATAPARNITVAGPHRLD